jgi:hypothetical protein
MKTNISFNIGQSFIKAIIAGSDISTCTSLIRIKKTKTSADPIIEVDNTITPPSTINVNIDSDTTKALTNGLYYYEVITVLGDTETVIDYGGCLIGDIALNNTGITTEDIFTVVNDKTLMIVLNDEMQYNRMYKVFMEYTTNEGTTKNTIIFTSQYHPLFCSIDDVKLILKKYGISSTDEEVYRTIKSNSEAIKTLTKRADITDWDAALPEEFAKYTALKTAYDLAMGVFVSLSTSAQQTKTLADLTVSYGNTPDSSTQMLKTLYEQLKPWYDMCVGSNIRANAASFTKANNATKEFSYPYTRLWSES